MRLLNFVDISGFEKSRECPDTARGVMRFMGGGNALAVSTLMFAMLAGPAAALSRTTVEECQFSPSTQMNIDTGVEPQLLIDGTCIDPDYNEETFVIDKTEQLTFQVPDGPLIPYTEVTGHFPATTTMENLPPNVRQSPTTFRQDYVFRFPAKEYWRQLPGGSGGRSLGQR